MSSNFIISVLAIFLFFGNPALAIADEIRIGALNDLSAATSDVGIDYALGIAEAVRYVNDEGGVNGKPIKLYQYDYGYRVPEVLARYKQFKRLGVAAVLGWHVVDTGVLSAMVAGDKIPFLRVLTGLMA